MEGERRLAVAGLGSAAKAKESAQLVGKRTLRIAALRVATVGITRERPL